LWRLQHKTGAGDLPSEALVRSEQIVWTPMHITTDEDELAVTNYESPYEWGANALDNSSTAATGTATSDAVGTGSVKLEAKAKSKVKPDVKKEQQLTNDDTITADAAAKGDSIDDVKLAVTSGNATADTATTSSNGVSSTTATVGDATGDIGGRSDDVAVDAASGRQAAALSRTASPVRTASATAASTAEPTSVPQRSSARQSKVTCRCRVHKYARLFTLIEFAPHIHAPLAIAHSESDLSRGDYIWIATAIVVFARLLVNKTVY
jgi:hypothetical protein